MRLFQTTTNDFQKMFQNDPWLFNINTCMLQDKVYPSKLLIQHNLHFTLHIWLSYTKHAGICPISHSGTFVRDLLWTKECLCHNEAKQKCQTIFGTGFNFPFFYPSCFWPRESTIFSYFRLRCVLLGHIPDIPVIWT